MRIDLPVGFGVRTLVPGFGLPELSYTTKFAAL